MSLSELARSLLRRWYLVLAGLLATVALCAGVMKMVPPSYEASASAILVPGSGMITEGANPLLYLGGLVQARDVLVRALGAEAVLKPITDQYPDAEISIGSDATTSGPMIAVTVGASSTDSAQGTLDALLDAVPTAFDQLQDEAGAPESARASVMVLAKDEEPTLVRKDQIRFVGAAGVVGLVGTVLLTGLVDGLLGQRRRRHASAGTATAGANDRPEAGATAPATKGRALVVPAPSPGPRGSSRP